MRFLMNNHSSVVPLFDKIAVELPNNIAVSEEGQQITYARLNTLSHKIAYHMINQEYNPSKVVGIMLPSGSELIACMIGCFRAGLNYMPIDAGYPDNKVDYMIHKAGASHIIGRKSELIKKFGESNKNKVKLLDIDELLKSKPPYDTSLYANVTKKSAYVFYTSGSTGKSKAVVGRHDSLYNFISWQIEYFNLRSGHHIAQYAPITFDASLKDILAALCSGATLNIVPPSIRHKMGQLIKWISDEKITHFHCVPSVFRLLSDYIEKEPTLVNGLRSLQCILLAGEKLYHSDVSTWNRLMNGQVELYNLYGATEATILSTVHKITDTDRNLHESVSVGKPIKMTKVAIVKQDKICRSGEIGEIYIKTPFLSAGYLDDPELEQKVFVQNPLNKKSKDIIYRTGDYGKYQLDGSIEVIGRKDGMLKINGVRVECGEIIAAVKQISGIQHVEVIPLQATKGETKIVCYYTGDAIPDKQFRETLEKDLIQVAIPSHIVHLEEFPKNLNGKVDLQSLPDPRKIVKNANHDELEGPIEQRLGKIWKEVLQVSSINRDDSFFSLGGHSIKAIRMISMIYREFNFDVSLKQLFEAKCIAQLAIEIESAVPQNETTPNISKTKVKQFSTLTNGQMRIWLMNQITGSSAFNVSLDFQVVGNLQVEVLKKAFELLLLQEPILRVIFKEGENGMVQNVVPFKDLTPPFTYVVNSDDSELLSLHHDQPFDLINDIPIRFLVINNGDNKHYLSLVIHHIVTDGWSMSVLVNKVINFYNKELKEKSIQTLKELPCEYFDYAQRQTDYLNSKKATIDKKYWVNQLKGHEKNVSFPTDFARKRQKTFNGDQQELFLDRVYKEKILAYCKLYDCSEFHVLLALVNFTLYKFTGSKDITVGTTVADRPDAADQNAIGFYVNTIPVRHRLISESNMQQLVSSIKVNFLNDLAHSRFPFEKIVSLHPSSGSMNRSPLFDVLVEVLDTDELTSQELKMAGLNTQRIEQPTKVAQYDVAIRWIPTEDNIKIIIEYNNDLYSTDIIAFIIDMLKKVLDELLADTSNSLDSISVLQSDQAIKMDTFTSLF